MSVGRVIKFGFKNFWRNAWLGAATIAIMVVTLFVVSSLVILNLLATTAITNIQNKVDLSIFFVSDVKDAKVEQMQKTILDFPEVGSVKLISKDEALDDFKTEHANDPEILKALEELEDNPLETTLIIRAKEPSQIGTIAERLLGDEYKNIISEVDYEDTKIVVDRLTGITDTLQRVALYVSIVAVLISIVVLYNTIRLTIYNHREEIDIMRLVGASNWFIRWPYMIEAMLYGVIAAIINTAVLYPIVIFSSPKLQAFFAGAGINLQDYFISHLLTIFGLQLAIAIILGIVSSLIAMSRYLKR